MIGLVVSCKTRKGKVEQLIVDHCAQHPIAFYMAEEENETRIYKFGPRDEEFRELLSNLLEKYRTSGEDISGGKKYELMKTYVPNYVSTCKQFFVPAVKDCGRFEITGDRFRSCIQPYNKDFQSQIQINFRQSGASPLDIESIKLRTPPNLSTQRKALK